MNGRYVIASENASRNRLITMIVIIVSMILGGSISLLTSRNITNPIRELKDAVNIVAQGDLTPEIKVKTNDEVSQLSADFNQMLRNLRHAEETLRESEERLKETAMTAKVGGWETDLMGNTLSWTEETFRIHELESDHLKLTRQSSIIIQRINN